MVWSCRSRHALSYDATLTLVICMVPELWCFSSWHLICILQIYNWTDCCFYLPVSSACVKWKPIWPSRCLVMGTFLFSHVRQWHQEELLCLFLSWGCVAYCGRLMSFLMSLQNSLDLSYVLISAVVSWPQKEGAINVPLILTLVRRCLSVFIVVSLHCNPLDSIPGPSDPKLASLTMRPRRLHCFLP